MFFVSDLARVQGSVNPLVGVEVFILNLLNTLVQRFTFWMSKYEYGGGGSITDEPCVIAERKIKQNDYTVRGISLYLHSVSGKTRVVQNIRLKL